MTERYCPNCGKPVAPDAILCRNCGADIGPTSPEGIETASPRRGNFWQRRSLLGKTSIVIGALVITGVLIPKGSDNPEPTTTTQAVAEAASTDSAATTTAPAPQTTTSAEPTTTTSASTTTTTVAKIVYEGAGDKVIRIDRPTDPALLYIKGNAARSNFAVWGYDDDGETTQLFVNAIDPYEGIRPLGMQEEGTTRLQVEAKGGWLIEVRPIDSARVAPVGDIVKGAGDDVLRVEGEADTAIIEGNAAQSNFAVWAYGGFFPDLLLNEIEQYSGETMVPPGTEYLVVEAKGPWAISLRE